MVRMRSTLGPDPNATEDALACYKACEACEDVLRRALLEASRRPELRWSPLRRALLECTSVAALTASFVKRRSPLHSMMCTLCVRACELCMERCEEGGVESSSYLREIAAACEDCATSCRVLATSPLAV